MEEKLDKANMYINELEEKSKLLEYDLSKTKSQSNNLKIDLDKLISREFAYENIAKSDHMLLNLSGLNETQFDLIFNCAEPYFHTMTRLVK